MSRPLRILEVTPFYAPAPAYGGAPVVAKEFSEALAARGHDLRVITTDVYSADERFDPARHGEADGPVEVTRLRNLCNHAAHDLQLYTPRSGPLRSRLRRECAWADIIHIHTHRNKLEIAAVRAARKTNTPYVIHGHGTVLPIERRLFVKKIYDFLWGDRALKDAAGFIAVTDAEVAQLEIKDIPKSKIRVIPNGLDLSKFASLPSPGLFRKKYQIPTEAPLVLYAGKITPRKGVEVLVDAVARMKNQNTRLAIIGADMGFMKIVRRHISERSLGSRTLVTGVLGWEELLSAYVDADACAYPSTLEIFGLVPFEAILCGTPAVVTDDCGCGEMIQKAGAGLLVPYADAQALAHALETLLKDKTAADNFVSQGQAFIRDTLAWPRLAEAAESFFMNLLKRT